jgi:hypothetical protein
LDQSKKDWQGNGGKGIKKQRKGKASLKFCRQFFLSYPELDGGRIGYAVRSQFEPEQKTHSILYEQRKESTTSPIGCALRNQSIPSESTSLIPVIIEAARSTEWQPGLLHPSLS